MSKNMPSNSKNDTEYASTICLTLILLTLVVFLLVPHFRIFAAVGCLIVLLFAEEFAEKPILMPFANILRFLVALILAVASASWIFGG